MLNHFWTSTKLGSIKSAQSIDTRMTFSVSLNSGYRTFIFTVPSLLFSIPIQPEHSQSLQFVQASEKFALRDFLQ